MTKRAVVVGINDYTVQDGGTGNVPNLSWCVPDAGSVANMLIHAFGFERDQVYCYTDSRATSENIKRALRYILNAGEAGDVACFYYSGHGARLPHPTRTGEFYETIIPYSGQWITDHEMFAAADQLQPSAVNFTVVLDSCHSGGMHNESEGANGVRSPRYADDLIERMLSALKTLIPCGICLPPAAREALKNNVSNVQRGSDGVIDLDEDPNRLLIQQAKSTLISACRADQVAQETGSLRHGLLTQGFLDIVNQSNFEIDHRALSDRLVDIVGGYMTRFFPGKKQTPQLRGQMNRMEESFLMGWSDCR